MIPYGKHHIDGNDIKAVTKIPKRIILHKDLQY